MSDRIYSEDEIMAVAFRRWGVSLKRIGNEWHGSCYKCGAGRDRFWVRADGGYTCRQCEVIGWLDEDKRDWKPDPLAREKNIALVAARRAERLKKSQEWEAGFSAGAEWQRWHDEMKPENRQWFKGRGFDDFMIDFYGVGYLKEKTVRYREKNGNEFYMPLSCYTYPARDPNNWEKIRNVHYRLVDAPEGCGKYRMQTGVIPYPFFANSNESNKLLIVEGANKAAVVYSQIGGAMQVMGNAGMDLCPEVIEEVKRDFKSIWIALDPGESRKKKSQHIKEKLGGAGIVYLPEKPDDFFLNGGTVDQFRAYFNQTRDK